MLALTSLHASKTWKRVSVRGRKMREGQNDDGNFYRVTSGIVWRCRADEPVFAAVVTSDIALETHENSSQG